MIFAVDYASPSMLESTRDESALSFSTNLRRPVRFHGVVRREGFTLRTALRALGEAIWSNDSWVAGLDFLDPVITVHPDRIFFEAFSQDQSVYAALIVDPDLFETEGEIVTGTTNVDFTAWLWGALGEMRTSRRTSFRIGPEGFEVTTKGAGGRFERKVELPDTWVRGFLQVQSAMALPGTRLEVQPVDLLAAIRYLRYTKARVSPRAIRYEFEPEKDVKLVLEPWEYEVPLEGCTHNYPEKKSTRLWGRRRLKLIESLLPFANSVQVFLKGRGMPSFYAVQLNGMTFVLGMTGFSEAGFTSTGGFDLLDESLKNDEGLLEPAIQFLSQRYHCSVHELAEQLKIEPKVATRVLVRLCRAGRCMFDVETRRYRHRELFEKPIDEAKYFPADLRKEQAAQLRQTGQVSIESCQTRETTKVSRLKTPDGPIHREITFRDWVVKGRVGQYDQVEVVVNDVGRVIFGRCGCPFFDSNLLSQGPCEHLLALFEESSSLRIDEPVSTAAEAPQPLASPFAGKPESSSEEEEED